MDRYVLEHLILKNVPYLSIINKKPARKTTEAVLKEGERRFRYLGNRANSGIQKEKIYVYKKEQFENQSG